MILPRFLCLLCLYAADIWASSHWIVTETGLIQPKDESPFLMAKPFDLLSFMNQDTRWQNIYNIHDDLIMRQKRINTLWADLEAEAEISKHIAENEYCQATGNIDGIDWYKSMLDDVKSKEISDAEFMIPSKKYVIMEVPDCMKISSLTFSMSAFEHLEGMINREHLNATPVLKLVFSLPSMTSEQFGHWISDVLRMNTTSWLHYNLAAIYWRAKGNVPKALECSRRAVHHAPRYYKNIALFCMGSILHQSKQIQDAIVVLGASVDHNPHLASCHFTLGQCYAIIGDYNNSLRHFNMSVNLKLELAMKYRNGVLCHMNMLTKMQCAQRTLKKLSDELAKYRELESTWIRIQTAFLKTMKLEQDYDYNSIEWITQKMSDITGLKVRDIRKDSERNSVIQYSIDTPIYNQQWKDLKGVAALETAHSLEKAIKAMDGKTGGPTMKLLAENIEAPLNETKILKEIGPMPTFPDVKNIHDVEMLMPIKRAEIKIELPKKNIKPDYTDTGILEPDNIGKVLYPSNMKVNRNVESFDKDPEWPSNEFCKERTPDYPETIEAIYPVYLPIEHKDISIKTLLTEKIGVPASKEHELPWHPPICPTDKELTSYTDITRKLQGKGLRVQVVSESHVINILRPKLLRYLSTTSYETVNKMQDAEIGHRIYVAMDKKLASKWVLYTLASLYWRVRGNAVNALNCLLTASRTVESRYKDVVLVSLASVVLEMGFLKDCATYAEEAYRVNAFEPPTNFLMAQVSLIKKNHKAQLFHMKQVIRVDPLYMNGFARNLLIAWSCILKQVTMLKELGVVFSGDKDGCMESENGYSMVCEQEGNNCHISQTSCSVNKESIIARMLELDDDLQKGAVDDIDAKHFNKYINSMPNQRNDKMGHQKSYNIMLKTVANLIKGCGADGCNEVDLRELDIKEEECGYQHLRLDYWLFIVSFKEQVTQVDNILPSDISSMTASNKNEPECRIPVEANDDFFMSRILSVETQDWQPLLSLMHQLAETFQLNDFTVLGAKIAKHIQVNPSTWWGYVAAAWWCGAAGRGACAVRCVCAAHALAPRRRRARALSALVALLHMQSKHEEAKHMAYLAFYTSPKSKIEAFLVGVSHTHNQEYNEATWMYRYAVTFDEKFLPAKACLHITMCLMLFSDHTKKKSSE